MSHSKNMNAEIVEERRIGRPPGVVGDETRRRLLDASKTVFAKSGYKEASNRLIAAAAGITTGAIYHYYPSKQALFLAVHGELQEEQLSRLNPVVDSSATLREALSKIVETMVEGRIKDPHSTEFFSVVRFEARRNPDISSALEDSSWLRLYDRLVALGVRTGEVQPEMARALKAVLAVFLLGYTQHAAEASPSGQDAAVRGILHLLEGRLMSAPSDNLAHG
ncbi:TetR/AcrR family transcriptional regulator [Sphingopyxis terrae]|uniref:TetR/AcrR family transcriptional regulator n=1 Tax=Sphingopyxis terrae TaxID=33052 RepID=UPI002A0B54CD|nr:TetR/AcrR family transcriptional regulator [Sphingopyxis terrae]MDX8356435.1 TetR/AcrR family transcriptional regulator [Sphingopyxis terrae]